MVRSNPEVGPSREQKIGSIKVKIGTLELEHQLIGRKLVEVRKLSSNYTLPQDARASYTLLYNMLDEFEEDLQLHFHLENNILFAKAIKSK